MAAVAAIPEDWNGGALLPRRRALRGNEGATLAVQQSVNTNGFTPLRRRHVEKTSFDRLIVDLRDAHLRGNEVIRLLEKLDGHSACELILDLHRVSDDLVPRVAALARFLGVKRTVKIAGLRANQIREMTAFGIELQAIVVGHWPRGSRTFVPPGVMQRRE
jgi:hypothetical protein